MTGDDHAPLLSALPHSGHVGRVLLAAAGWYGLLGWRGGIQRLNARGHREGDHLHRA